MHRTIGLALTALLLAPLGPAALGRQQARQPDSAPGKDIVVKGARDIVVNGRARRCTPLPGDPMDRIDVSPGHNEPTLFSELVPIGSGHFVFEPDSEPITGPDVWQRIGRGLNDYVFRAPLDGRPLCIGGSAPALGSWAGLRRIVDAVPLRGKRLRVTMWVATGAAHQVNFWLTGATSLSRIYNGGDTNHSHWGGSHGWTPVLLEVGPVSEHASFVSYGVDLGGPGSVWIYRPALEVVTDETPGRRDETVMIGDGQRH